jgi:hypothetical protein
MLGESSKLENKFFVFYGPILNIIPIVDEVILWVILQIIKGKKSFDLISYMFQIDDRIADESSPMVPLEAPSTPKKRVGRPRNTPHLLSTPSPKIDKSDTSGRIRRQTKKFSSYKNRKEQRKNSVSKITFFNKKTPKRKRKSNESSDEEQNNVKKINSALNKVRNLLESYLIKPVNLLAT